MKYCQVSRIWHMRCFMKQMIKLMAVLVVVLFGAISLNTHPSAADSGIPAGFVLKTFSQTTAIFDRPDGQAIVGNRILAGQQWYVNPMTAKDKDGDEWYEVYVS